MDAQTRAQWEKDLKDLHMVYDYNTKDKQGNPEKWRYEIWFQMEVSCWSWGVQGYCGRLADEATIRTASSTASTADPWRDAPTTRPAASNASAPASCGSAIGWKVRDRVLTLLG